MSETTLNRTTVGITDEQQQFVKNNDVNLSELVRDAINARMGQDDERLRVKQQLQERKSELEEITNREERLEAQIQALEDRLDGLDEDRERPVQEAIDKLSETKQNQSMNTLQKRFEFLADNLALDITSEELHACFNYATEFEENDDGYATTQELPDAEYSEEEREKAREYIEDEIFE